MSQEELHSCMENEMRDATRMGNTELMMILKQTILDMLTKDENE